MKALWLYEVSPPCLLHWIGHPAKEPLKATRVRPAPPQRAVRGAPRRSRRAPRHQHRVTDATMANARVPNLRHARLRWKIGGPTPRRAVPRPRTLPSGFKCGKVAAYSLQPGRIMAFKGCAVREGGSTPRVCSMLYAIYKLYAMCYMLYAICPGG